MAHTHTVCAAIPTNGSRKRTATETTTTTTNLYLNKRLLLLLFVLLPLPLLSCILHSPLLLPSLNAFVLNTVVINLSIYQCVHCPIRNVSLFRLYWLVAIRSVRCVFDRFYSFAFGHSVYKSDKQIENVRP